ncbi:MAG: hypothetical protein ACI8X5_002384 [Planctomycetota bacterium]|jgi:hypothetical protein
MSLPRYLLFSLFVLCSLSASFVHARSTDPEQETVFEVELREVSKELLKLYGEDQKDQIARGEAHETEISERQSARRARFMENVTQGLLVGPEDYDHAAWLLCHGSAADDFFNGSLALCLRQIRRSSGGVLADGVAPRSIRDVRGAIPALRPTSW